VTSNWFVSFSLNNEGFVRSFANFGKSTHDEDNNIHKAAFRRLKVGGFY